MRATMAEFNAMPSRAHSWDTLSRKWRRNRLGTSGRRGNNRVHDGHNLETGRRFRPIGFFAKIKSPCAEARLRIHWCSMNRLPGVWLLAFSLLLIGLANAQPRYDLLIKSGHIVDAKNRVSAIRDVAIKDHEIPPVAADIPADQAFKVIEVEGLYVTPGLVECTFMSMRAREHEWRLRR